MNMSNQIKDLQNQIHELNRTHNLRIGDIENRVIIIYLVNIYLKVFLNEIQIDS
jgi:hypothetical protein